MGSEDKTVDWEEGYFCASLGLGLGLWSMPVNCYHVGGKDGSEVLDDDCKFFGEQGAGQIGFHGAKDIEHSDPKLLRVCKEENKISSLRWSKLLQLFADVFRVSVNELRIHSSNSIFGDFAKIRPDKLAGKDHWDGFR